MHHAAIESRQFDEFATWLTRTVEFALVEPGGTTAGEIAEKLSNTDLHKVLSYIGGGLKRSKLEGLLGSPSAEVLRAVEAGAGTTMGGLQEHLIQHKHSTSDSTPVGLGPIDLLYHAVGLARVAEGVIHTVNERFRASIERGGPLAYTQALVSEIRAMRMVREAHGTLLDQIVTYVATVAADGSGRAGE